MRQPKIVGALLTVLLLAGCSLAAGTPPPSVTDFQGLVELLNGQGIAVDNVVSGDAGCPDPTLSTTAKSLDAQGLDQTQPTKVYLYTFGDAASFDRLHGTIESCARTFARNQTTYESVAVAPFVAAGPGPWAPMFKARLESALRRAAGGA